MKFIERITFSPEKKLAEQLVSQLAKDIPSDLMGGQGRPLTVNRVTKLLERTCRTAIAYQNEKKMGMVGRAVLANSFKWGLLSKGYTAEFADMAVEALVVSLAKGLPAPNSAD